MQLCISGSSVVWTVTLLLLCNISYLSLQPCQQSVEEADYARRVALASKNGRIAPRDMFIRWVHIPKTGTSFVNTLIHWSYRGSIPGDGGGFNGLEKMDAPFVTCRKERPQDLRFGYTPTISWDWLHLNMSGRAWLGRNCPALVGRYRDSGRRYFGLRMHRALEEWEVRFGVGLFREPRERVYSNYRHLSFHFDGSREAAESLREFVRRREFQGQSCKMLLGLHYRSNATMGVKDGVKAAEVVKRLAFVGLTEEFELSVRLFHAMFGGVPRRREFENIRPGIRKRKVEEEEWGGWRDGCDEVVYEAARKRFWRDVGVWKAVIEQDGLGVVVVNNKRLARTESMHRVIAS